MVRNIVYRAQLAWQFSPLVISADNKNKTCSLSKTRHGASTSMYSLTYCVRVISPQRYHWKPAVQAAAVMLRTPPVDGQSPASSVRTPADPANPPNSAQLGGIPYHSPMLHPCPSNSVGIRPQTDTQIHRQTNTQTRVTTIHFASSTTHAKCNYWKFPSGNDNSTMNHC